MHHQPAPPPERRSWPRRLLNRLEVDQAVFFAIAARLWQFLAGPVTLLLIAHYFSPEVQGYYYTFWSMIGLQLFFELSFQQVVINVASHEWEKLSLTAEGDVQGDASALSRLSSLVRVAVALYGAAAALFLVLVSLIGIVFFSQGRVQHLIEWQLPWLTLVGLTSIAFWMTPLMTVLEGCNQVRNVYLFHLIRAVAGNLVVWCCIPLGADLWTPAIASLVRLGCEFWLVGLLYRRFFVRLLRKSAGPRLDWRREVWPMQWRMALKGMFGYFNAYLINPVIFLFHGEVAAGQMGMTWQVLQSLQAACSSWVKTRTARFGMLVSRKHYAELDRIFFRLTWIALTVLALACAAFWLFDAALYASGSRFAGRLLPPLPTALFSLAVIIALIPDFQWTYIHAHKQSPYIGLTVLASLVNGGLIWWWGSWYAATGAAAAYFAMNLCFALPVWTLVWYRLRREWHRAPERS